MLNYKLKSKIEEMLKLHPERSNFWLAEDCGTYDRIIKRTRKDLENRSIIEKFERLRGRDGIWYSRGAKKIKVSCDYCGKVKEMLFSKIRYHRHFCDKDCYIKCNRGKNHPQYKEKIKVVCDYCGKVNERKFSYIKNWNHRFCNTTCYAKWNRRENNPRYSKKAIKCETCEILFSRLISQIKRNNHNFCSFYCFDKWQRKNLSGENAYGWIDGRTPLTELIRNCQEYKKWRNDIFKKGNYSCQECGSYRNFLHAHHHPKRFAIILSEFLKEYDQFSPIEDKETLFRLAIKYKPFWDVNNGKTVCEDCHLEKGYHKKVMIDRKEI